ncbi:MAG TPA: endonuclease/exonuclease/phosphatase family protein [Nocardioidaceae bacterium]|nr:endonuclease/exonuclease/phosphatase family protein [Nocardioidaceae bacterium]
MRTIRVATYNLYLGADVTTVFTVADAEELEAQAGRVLEQLLGTDFPSRAEAIARLLVREGVDVVGLQEVARWSREVEPGRNEVWLDFLGELLDALARAGAEYDVHALTESFRGGASVAGREAMSVLGHNAILVRRASGLGVLAERTGRFSTTLDVVTKVPGLVIDIARSWGWVDLAVDGRSVRLVNTHHEAWDDRVRALQRDELLTAIASPGIPVVVVGDFNEVPSKVGMPAEYVDAWAVAGDGGPGPTCGQRADLTGESNLAVRIDYVWARDAEVTGCRVVGDRPEERTAAGLWPSDHACVVADVQL